MNFGVDYDKLVAKVFRDRVPDAREKFRVLSQEADTRRVLDEHAQKYMDAKGELELYSPFRDFAEALFRSAKLPFHFIESHAKRVPNDCRGNGNPARKSVQ